MPGRKPSNAPSDTTVVTPVPDSATAGQFVPANSARLAVSVLNTSSAALYLLVGPGTASSTNCVVRLQQWDYYEVPARSTDRISGVWASDPGDGSALVTEYF